MADPSDDRGTSPPDASVGARARKKRLRRQRRAWASLTLLAMLVAGILVARTQWATREIAQFLRTKVAEQTGLELDIERVYFSWRHFAVRAEGIDVRHPTEGPLAHVDTLEVAPAFTSLFRSHVKISRIGVDGGRVDLRFRGGQLVNGPRMAEQPPPQEPPELPFRDLAISDVRVHVEHDEVGTLDLPSVDLDVHNVSSRRVLVGVLSQSGGALRGSRLRELQCFEDDRIGRIEVRAELANRFRVLRVALARAEVGRTAVRVRDTTVPLDLRGTVRTDLELSGALPDLLCPVPNPPEIRGQVAVRVRAAVEPETGRFEASGSARADDLSFTVRYDDRAYTYGLGDEISARFTATQDAVRVDSLRGRYAGARITSPGSRPDRPLTVRLGERPTLEGHLDVAGLEFPQLMHQVTVTSFTKVLWTIDAGVDAHGELWRFAHPPDREHPALWFDVAADTRNFAILKDFWQRTPQQPLIAIPRGRVTGQITVDAEHLRFQRLAAEFGRSRAEVGLVQVRLKHDDDIPDFVLEGARGHDVRLEDIGRVADLTVGGTASFTAQGRGPFADPVVTGQAHLRNFVFNGLPLGDIDTRPDAPWRYRDIRVDVPVVDARAGRSTFVVRDAFLDFHRWTLEAGARVASSNFFTDDFFHMFGFEGDPTFAPYVGRTMPTCPTRVLAARGTPDEAPCVPPGSSHVEDGRRMRVPPGTDSGYLEARLSYVLGRPGDDPDGVLDVDVRGRDLVVRAYDETIRDVDAHVAYRWLVRSRGYRGARVRLHHARGRVAGGTVEATGGTDLGGVAHIVARAQHVALDRLDLLSGTGVSGSASGVLTMEGLPAAPRLTADLTVRNLVAQNRNLGDAAVSLRTRPEGAFPADPTARPPRNRYDVAVDALGSALHAEARLLIPWRGITWRDVDGVSHPDWERDWAHAELAGRAELTRTLDLLPFLPTSAVARLGAGAVANVRARVEVERAVLAELRRADVRVAVDQLELGAQGVRFALAPGATLAACVHDGTYWVDPAAARSGAACARVPAGMRPGATSASVAALPVARVLGPEGTRLGISGGGALAGRLALALHGDVDLARIAPLLPSVTWARGTARVHVAVEGDTDNPRLSGTLSLDGGALGADVLPDPIDDIHLHVRMSGTQIALEQARAQFGSSSIDLTGGYVRYQGREIERVHVPLVVRNLALTPQAGLEVALNADTRLTWSHGDELPLFDGDVTLLRVRYTRPIAMAQDASGDIRATSSDTGDQAYDPNRDRVRLDLRVHAREPIRVLNNLLDAEIQIAEHERPFRVLGTDQRMGVLGTLTIPRGRVLFRGYDFEVRRGRVEFDNPERIQPNFDIGAQVDIRRGTQTSSRGVSVEGNQWRIALHAYGTPERFALDMSSEPALSREDIAFLLAFRMTRAEIDQIASSGNLTTAGSGLAVEALASATGVDQAVGRTVRTFIPVIEEFRIGSAYSPAQGRTVPQVSVGRRINDRVRIDATVNTTEQREMRATTDVRIDDRTSLQFGYENVNDAVSSQLGNVGADLRWRLEFE